MNGKATCIKITKLPNERGYSSPVEYIYVLDPPAVWNDVVLDEIAIQVRRGSTCVFKGEQRLQCRDLLGGGVLAPDEFLRAFCGYKETRLSRLRRLVKVIETPVPPTLTNYVSYAFKDEWHYLSEDAQLIATAIIRGADLAVANAEKEYSDTEDDPILSELQTIRKLLEAHFNA
jgi:hypothetical protein